MTAPTCPVEFALWWCKSYHRVSACVWSPNVEQVELFLASCKIRAQSWTNRLDDLKINKWNPIGMIAGSSTPDHRQDAIRDILVWEPLVRLLACTANAIRAGEIRQAIHPILHEAFVSIRQARCIALEQLIHEFDRGAVWARSINRMRIVLEQWTDMLLGIASAKQHTPIASLAAYGFQKERIQEFAYETIESGRKLSPMLEDWFMVQGIRRTLRSFGPSYSLHPDLDVQLRYLAKGLLSPSSFRDECLNHSLQLDQRFEAIEHWFSMLTEEKVR